MKYGIKSIKLNQRSGVSIEFDKVGSVNITIAEALAIIAFFKGHLTAEEMESKFDFNQRTAIFKYMDAYAAKTIKMFEEFAGKRKFTKVQNDFQKTLEALLISPDCELDFIEDFLGWKLPEAKEHLQARADEVFLKALQDDQYELDYFIYLLKYKDWGKPSQEVLEKLEKKFGPLPNGA